MISKSPRFVYSHFTCWDGRKCRICSSIFQRWCDTQNPKVTVSVSPQEKQGRWFVEGPQGAPVPWKQVAQHRTAACLQGIFVDIQEMHKSKTFPPSCRRKRHLQYNTDWRGDYLHSCTWFTPPNVSISDRKVYFSFLLFQRRSFSWRRMLVVTLALIYSTPARVSYMSLVLSSLTNWLTHSWAR